MSGVDDGYVLSWYGSDHPIHHPCSSCTFGREQDSEPLALWQVQVKVQGLVGSALHSMGQQEELELDCWPRLKILQLVWCR